MLRRRLALLLPLLLGGLAASLAACGDSHQDNSVESRHSERDSPRVQDPVLHEADEQPAAGPEWADLDDEWVSRQDAGVEVFVDAQGGLRFRGTATSDGSAQEPTVWIHSTQQFTRENFEQVSLELAVPARDADGQASNAIAFGVCVEMMGAEPDDASADAARVGIAFVDRTIRVHRGPGCLPEPQPRTRLDPKWPGDGFVRLSIRRVDPDLGTVTVSINDIDLITMSLFPFRRAPGTGRLWIGGAGGAGERFDVSIRDLRVVRAKRSP